jgi:ubiquinone/menaquinone biosynthesis C-methylase UbiE
MTTPAPEQLKTGVTGVFDRAAATYDQVGVDFFGRIGHELVVRTAPSPGQRVLDLGCGRGASALPAARAVGPTGRVLATDLAPTMVHGLRQQATELPWLKAEVGDAEQPPPGPWDVVQASLVLFFLPGLSDALDRYREVLTPQGRLGFTWFGRADDSWDDVQHMISESIPEDRRPPNLPGSGPFSSVSAQHSLLAEHGFGHAETTDFRVELSFRDPDHWWSWIWSQGQRHLLEQLDATGSLEDTEHRVNVVLDQRHRDGTLRWWTEVRCTVARP